MVRRSLAVRLCRLDRRAAAAPGCARSSPPAHPRRPPVVAWTRHDSSEKIRSLRSGVGARIRQNGALRAHRTQEFFGELLPLRNRERFE